MYINFPFLLPLGMKWHLGRGTSLVVFSRSRMRCRRLLPAFHGEETPASAGRKRKVNTIRVAGLHARAPGLWESSYIGRSSTQGPAEFCKYGDFSAEREGTGEREEGQGT